MFRIGVGAMTPAPFPFLGRGLTGIVQRDRLLPSQQRADDAGHTKGTEMNTVSISRTDTDAIRTQAHRACHYTDGTMRAEAYALVDRAVSLDSYFESETAAVSVQIDATTFTDWQQAILRAAGVETPRQPVTGTGFTGGCFGCPGVDDDVFGGDREESYEDFARQQRMEQQAERRNEEALYGYEL